MAFRSLSFLTRFARPTTRHSEFSIHSPVSLSSLHDAVSIPSPNHPSPHSTNLDERLVLRQISQLLPIPTSQSDPPVSKRVESRAEAKPLVDGFLSPEEKLRGIFLQKLKGKAAIEQALSNVGVDLNVDVLGKVVNSGNMSGESMVTFFNWAVKQPQVPKNTGTYCVMVKAIGRRKFFKFMMQVLRDMRTNGIEGDLSMLQIIIDSFVRVGYVSRAIQVFRNLDEYLGMNRDTKALNVILLCLCQRSHVGTANSVLRSMKGKIAFDVTTYNAVVGGWSRIGKVNEIERIMKEMEGDGFCPDRVTFGFLFESLGRAGRIDEAIEGFRSMKERNCQPDTAAYNAMIFNFLSVGDFDECMKYYNAMLSDDCEPTLDTYTRIITAFLRVRKVADALQMFDEMLVGGVLPSTGTITLFVKQLCSYGPPYAALVICKKARKLGCQISMDAYKIMLMRLSKFGKCGTMLTMWQEMQECGYDSDVEVYEYIINGLCNIGQLENAVLVMEESLCKGFCPSRLVYSKLSNKLLASNNTERAYKLFSKIKRARLLENARNYWRANGWQF